MLAYTYLGMARYIFATYAHFHLSVCGVAVTTLRVAAYMVSESAMC